uniref:lipoyl(octanoyl) transferase n=1 Tax=termite gut metagenome TaxID=433724 RepID=S0DFT5_9ZZZZ
MKPSVTLLDLGVVDYGEALALQRELFDKVVAERAGAGGQSGAGGGHLILCEHPHVYTLGKSGRAENLLVSEEFLHERGAALYRVERGGDITYHGPGQVVGYPILDLEKAGLGLRGYIETLEQSVIETMGEFGIEAGRSEGKTGVWVKDPDGLSGGDRAGEGSCEKHLTAREQTERKICAIGVRSSRFVAMHGFALNVATDLEWFGHINPCGFTGGAVTSMEKETGRKVEMSEVKRVLRERLEERLGVRIVKE